MGTERSVVLKPEWAPEASFFFFLKNMRIHLYCKKLNTTENSIVKHRHPPNAFLRKVSCNMCMHCSRYFIYKFKHTYRYIYNKMLNMICYLRTSAEVPKA